VLRGFEAPWWIAGGWALDLFLGREIRKHEDLDIAILRRDQGALRNALVSWDLRYATSEHTLEPWDGRTPEPPVHAIWARRVPGAPWLCEFLLNEEAAGTWLFRRDPRVTCPLAAMGRSTATGVQLLAPEIVWLYKVDTTKAKDEIDFDATTPRLSESGRRWLADAIQLCHPGHRWVARLLDMTD